MSRYSFMRQQTESTLGPRYVNPAVNHDWRQEVSDFQHTFDTTDVDLDDAWNIFLQSYDFVEHKQNVLLMLDIAKRYLHPIEAEVLFLFLRQRRNKEISAILNIQEPEVARYKGLIIKKCIIFGTFCYTIHISQYAPYIATLLDLNEKQEQILLLFFQFRSLKYISEHINSKSSNMHRSLASIKQRIIKILPQHPELQIVLDFYDYSRYINNSNEDMDIVEELV